MKFGFLKRAVLFLFWLLSVVAGALSVMLLVWPDTIYGLFEIAYGMIGKNRMDMLGAVLLAVYVVLAAAAVLIIFSGRSDKRDRGFITVDSSDSGRTRIAVGAVEQMIRQAVRGISGIADMKSGIKNYDDAISINTDAVLLDGAHVPTVTMNIKRSIRSYIELNCGVAVREVSVNVRGVVDPEAKNKRGKKGKGYEAAAVSPVAYENPMGEEIPPIAEEAPYADPEPQVIADYAQPAAEETVEPIIAEESEAAEAEETATAEETESI